MTPTLVVFVVTCAAALLLGAAWLLQRSIYERWEHGWRRCNKCQRWHNKHGEIRQFVPIEEVNPNYVWILCPSCNQELQPK